MDNNENKTREQQLNDQLARLERMVAQGEELVSQIRTARNDKAAEILRLRTSNISPV